ncbi:hypothetical protein BDZ97DRAFT_955993 [Flammula alnicola]|nr:hypothetical protein BDZ97DRAFT_955993 [Flammula alnicola]
MSENMHSRLVCPPTRQHRSRQLPLTPITGNTLDAPLLTPGVSVSSPTTPAPNLSQHRSRQLPLTPSQATRSMPHSSCRRVHHRHFRTDGQRSRGAMVARSRIKPRDARCIPSPAEVVLRALLAPLEKFYLSNL